MSCSGWTQPSTMRLPAGLETSCAATMPRSNSYCAGRCRRPGAYRERRELSDRQGVVQNEQSQRERLPAEEGLAGSLQSPQASSRSARCGSSISAVNRLIPFRQDHFVCQSRVAPRSNPLTCPPALTWCWQYLGPRPASPTRCGGLFNRVLVGRTGHYLNSRTELAESVHELFRTHCDRLFVVIP